MKVEPICYDVAKHFLRHVKVRHEDMRRIDEQELAEQVQKLCVDYAGSMAAEEAGECDI